MNTITKVSGENKEYIWIITVKYDFLKKKKPITLYKKHMI